MPWESQSTKKYVTKRSDSDEDDRPTGREFFLNPFWPKRISFGLNEICRADAESLYERRLLPYESLPNERTNERLSIEMVFLHKKKFQ